MGNPRSLGLRLIFVCASLVATTYTCLGVGNVSVFCSQKERFALLRFKQSIVDPSGMLSSWIGSDCCLWERIQCDGVTRYVEGLHLRGDYLGGLGHNYLVGKEVNSSLGELTHLKYLDLSQNDFKGSRIPEVIGSFKQLIYLNLSIAGFQGIIPPHIGNLSNLKVLDLNSNKNLIADDMIRTFSLPSLEHLDLGWVDLSGWDIELYLFPSLKELRLRNCGLSNIDLGFSLNSSRTLSNIKHLDLGFNSFKGPLPGFFRNMTSLEFLDLSKFNLSLSWNFANLLNMIPSLSELHLSSCGLDKTHVSSPHLNFSTLSNIQHLDLSSNLIEGIFPSVLTNLSSLRVLDLVGNMLHSSFPSMPNLLELYLSSNQFKHIDHLGIWRQCHLKHLIASFNPIEMIDSPKNESECSQYALERLVLSVCSNGTIPESLGRLVNLRDIDLSISRLIGTIPESLGRLQYLEALDLSVNQLDGSIPESFGKLTALKYLHLRDNWLTGTIPVSIWQLPDLHSLVISNNSLEGVVSEAHLTNVSMLKHLEASSNTNLTFKFSREWIPPFQLVSLHLSSCNIGNGFPQWLRNQRNLEELVLSNASISGPLPTWLRKIPIINFLDLSHNQLNGPLTNLPNGKVFVYGNVGSLFLENNIFSESIPRSLCTRADLTYLDLSRNRLTGKIPNCLENLQQLNTMIFSSNRLSGVIPSSIALKSTSLEWLKLNDNDLIGEIPLELGNIQYLKVLDLGDNKFYGNIPEWIGEKLTYLAVLRLHQNNFTGRIPGSLCRSSYLQILDVAYNNLMGTIPPCLGELGAMVNNSRVRQDNPNLDSDENVIQVMKGVAREYTTIWELLYNMDLSSNKLVGEIPVELTALSMLVGLNLSNNHLSGVIPHSIGNMTSLESLDFSKNELNGIIPRSLTALTFLSHLNLSHNGLSGRIPTGNQLQTLNDPSAYTGNKGLCGLPLPMNCEGEKVPSMYDGNKKKYEATDDPMMVWLFYMDIMSGFATGFWGVIGVLLFKEQRRRKLLMFVDDTMDTTMYAIYFAVGGKSFQYEERKRSRIDPVECK